MNAIKVSILGSFLFLNGMGTVFGDQAGNYLERIKPILKERL